MTVEELKTELEKQNEDDRKQLLIFLSQLRLNSAPAYKERISERLEGYMTTTNTPA